MTTVYIRGGTIIDPEKATIERGNVLVRDGRIVAVGEIAENDTAEAEVVDASGLYVAPGFIDLHAHVFARPGGVAGEVTPDRVGVRQGVTCVVDAGSAGANTIDEFVATLDDQRTLVYPLVNIGSPGHADTKIGHSSRPELVSLKKTVRAAERHRQRVCGIKVQASYQHTGGYGMTAVALARKAAELCGLPLMVHIGNAPPVLDDVLAHLRAGDIVTHTYHGKVGGALTFGGAPLPALIEAVARGVIVDIGHGSASFSFHTAEKALAAGLPFHTISTDLHRGNLERPVVSLARTMTKLWHLGLSLLDVVRAVTVTPARAVRLDADGFGTLAPGGPAHVTLFRLNDEPIDLEDANGTIRRAEQWIQPVSVYVSGQRFDVDAPL